MTSPDAGVPRQSWQRIGEPGDGLPIQVVPLGDLREHVQDPRGLCPCMPRLREDPPVVVHNAYDGRETGEVGRKALRLLSLALAVHGHQWTDEERDAFEHAWLVLDMHWPPKVAEDPPRGSG